MNSKLRVVQHLALKTIVARCSKHLGEFKLASKDITTDLYEVNITTGSGKVYNVQVQSDAMFLSDPVSHNILYTFTDFPEIRDLYIDIRAYMYTTSDDREMDWLTKVAAEFAMPTQM